MVRLTIRFIWFLAVLFLPGAALAQTCLHGADSTDEQKARKREALGATRQINNLQANRRPEAGQPKYLNQTEMAIYYADLTKKTPARQPLIFDPASEVLPGWQLTLDKTEHGYWFMIKDKTDPCGFAYVSNQQGVIFTAEPIR